MREIDRVATSRKKINMEVAITSATDRKKNQSPIKSNFINKNK